MTTETVTDFRVEKIEEEKNVTWCDVCNQKIKNDEPSTEVVARPEVTNQRIEVPRELSEYGGDVIEHGVPIHISRYDMKRIADDVKTEVRKANDRSTIKAITVHEDVCGSCFEEMAGEELGDVPDLTVEDVELERIDDFREKAKNVAKYPRGCGYITGTIAMLSIIVSLLTLFEGAFLFAGGSFTIFFFFLISTWMLFSWSWNIKNSYSP